MTENNVKENIDPLLVRSFAAGNMLKLQNRTAEIMTYMVHDIFGVQLVNGTVDPYSMTSPQMKFSSGIYFVVIKTTDFNKTEKVMVK